MLKKLNCFELTRTKIDPSTKVPSTCDHEREILNVNFGSKLAQWSSDYTVHSVAAAIWKRFEMKRL